MDMEHLRRKRQDPRLGNLSARTSAPWWYSVAGLLTSASSILELTEGRSETGNAHTYLLAPQAWARAPLLEKEKKTQRGRGWEKIHRDSLKHARPV